MTNTFERGSIPMAVVIAIGIVVALIVGIGVCGDALFEDEDEVDDLGWVPLPELADDDEGSRNNRNRNGNDCNRAKAQCSDDDFSPSFDKSPVEDSFNVQVCVTPGSCTDEPDPS